MKFDFSRLNWPQAVVLLGVIAGIVLFFTQTPPEVLAKLPWATIGGVLLAGVGGVTSGFLGHAVKRNPERRTRTSDPGTDTDADGVR